MYLIAKNLKVHNTCLLYLVNSPRVHKGAYKVLNDPDPDDGRFFDDRLPASPETTDKLLPPARLVRLNLVDVNS